MNQNPEQLARDRIDDQLKACGWLIQDKKSFNLAADVGVAIRDFTNNRGDVGEGKRQHSLVYGVSCYNRHKVTDSEEDAEAKPLGLIMDELFLCSFRLCLFHMKMMKSENVAYY